MALKLPGYEWWPLDGVPGVPYDEWDDPKALAHTTEGTSIDGAVSAYRAYPPHLIVDPWRRRKVQHVDLERAAYALWNADADDSRCYQIEIVGFAAQTHTWPDEALRWLGTEVARPLHEYAGVPYVVVWKGFRRDGEMPYALADPDSPLRLTQAELDRFSGWLGHQHIPGDSHWDPGGLDVPKILAFAQEKEQPDMDATERAWLKESTLRLRSIHTNGFKDVGESSRSMQGDLSWVQDQMKVALKPVLDALGTIGDRVARLEASGVPVTVDYDRAADATADEIDRRARDDDPATGPAT